jgi:hypothetical protein
MPIGRWEGGEPPVDEVEDFVRRRRWFHVHALALGGGFVIVSAGWMVGVQRIAAIGGLALVLASIAAFKCGRTLITLLRHPDGRDWHEDRPQRGESLLSVVLLLVLGLAIAGFGAIGRIDALVMPMR